MYKVKEQFDGQPIFTVIDGEWRNLAASGVTETIQKATRNQPSKPRKIRGISQKEIVDLIENTTFTFEQFFDFTENIDGVEKRTDAKLYVKRKKAKALASPVVETAKIAVTTNGTDTVAKAKSK